MYRILRPPPRSRADRRRPPHLTRRTVPGVLDIRPFPRRGRPPYNAGHGRRRMEATDGGTDAGTDAARAADDHPDPRTVHDAVPAPADRDEDGGRAPPPDVRGPRRPGGALGGR